ncbi:MAG: sigma-54 dependent transcriptional regulator [Candidatus Micrarchaeota archaeon]
MSVVRNGNGLMSKKPVMVGVSQPMEDLRRTISRFAKYDYPVLITGPTGSGKELVARGIHFQSTRTNDPFVAINCTSLPGELMESELFGHSKGAFTGADSYRPGKFVVANGGTLLFDEIGDMPPSMQAKLLRVLEDKSFEPLGSDRPVEVDVRIMAATNRDLDQMIHTGAFRLDLYHRLRVLEISVPSLSERLIDVPLLVEHFLNIHNDKYGESVSITSDAMTPLCRFAGTMAGNIRELIHVVQRLAVESDNGAITKPLVAGYMDAGRYHSLASDGGSIQCNPDSGTLLQDGLGSPLDLGPLPGSIDYSYDGIPIIGSSTSSQTAPGDLEMSKHSAPSSHSEPSDVGEVDILSSIAADTTSYSDLERELIPHIFKIDLRRSGISIYHTLKSLIQHDFSIQSTSLKKFTIQLRVRFLSDCLSLAIEQNFSLTELASNLGIEKSRLYNLLSSYGLQDKAGSLKNSRIGSSSL